MPMPMPHVRFFRADFHLRSGRARPINFAVKTFFILSLLSVLAIFSSACNTTIGLGRDMRILGESMENQAQKTYRGESESSAAPVY